MRISGTEPSSVILSQTMKFKKLKRFMNETNESFFSPIAEWTESSRLHIGDTGSFSY